MIEAVEFRALWTAPLADEALRAFERELSDQLVDVLAPQPGPGQREQIVAIKTRIRRVWELGDLPRFIAMALALHRLRTLNAGYVRRLASALLTQDRFEEAVALFALVEQDDHLRWHEEARALAGAGRLAQAGEAAARSAERLAAAPPEPHPHAAVKTLERRPSRLDLAAGWPLARVEARQRIQAGRMEEAAAALRGFLQRRAGLLIEAVRAATEPEARDWPQMRRRTGACLLLGLAAQAADRLVGGLPPGAQVPEGALEEAAPLFAATAAAAPAARPHALLQAFARLAPAGEARCFAELALKTLAGEASVSELLGAPPPSEAVARAVATMLAQSGRPEPAMALFGGLSVGKRREAPRLELAVCLNRAAAARLALRTTPAPRPRRIFDLFHYNGELEILKIKLHEMGPWVDGFVLVESAMTFSGRPKPLHFPEARAELEPFLPKIRHVVVERFPDHVASAWSREFYQRDQAAAALAGVCAPDDLVLVTDVDEVIDRRAIEGFDGEAALLHMRLFRFFLNYGLADSRRRGIASLWRARHLARWSPSLARTVLTARLAPCRIEDAGWHFTSVGAARDIARKLASYSHRENDRPDSEAHYGGVLERLRAGELEAGWERCGLEALPAYVAENRERLAGLLL